MFQFGEEIGLNELNQTEFFDISDFKITNDRIYIADRAKNRLFLFHENGKLIHNTGREGRGPGEFIAGPKQITPLGEKIYVIAYQYPLLYVYDNQLNYIRNEEFDKNLINTYSMKNDRENVYILGTSFWEDRMVVFDPSINRVETVHIGVDIAPVLSIGKIF